MRKKPGNTKVARYTVGFGFDVHRITKRKKELILGGVRTPCGFGLQAISDGDVVLHALSDAICGACNLGDIGDLFPPQAVASKNIDSRSILGTVLKKIASRYTVGHIDITICAEKPKLSGLKKAMLISLKQQLGLSSVNLKIKSKEGLDILGGKTAISVFALALVYRNTV